MLWSVKGLEVIFFMTPRHYSSTDLPLSAVSKITGSANGMKDNQDYVSADIQLAK